MLKKNIKFYKNFSNVLLIHFINILSPILVYKHVISNIGVDNFGKIIYHLAINGFFVLIVSYGFNLYSLREISLNRLNLKKISDIFSQTLSIKLTLLLLIFTVVGSINYFNYNRSDFYLSILTFYVCIDEIANFFFYYAGIEKTKIYSRIIAFQKFLTALIVLYILNNDNILIYPLILFLLSLCFFVFNFFYLIKKENINFKFLLSLDTVRSAWTSFTIVSLPTLYIHLTKISITLFSSKEIIVIYEIIEKISNLLKRPLVVLTQTLLPKTSFDKDVNFINKITKYLFLAYIFIIILSFSLNKIIFTFFIDDSFYDSYKNIIIFSFLISLATIPIALLSNILGFQKLLAFGKENLLQRGLFFGFLTFIVLTIFSALFFEISIIVQLLVLSITEITVLTILYKLNYRKL